MFLNSQVFVDFVNTCREWEIKVPVVLGIMCLNDLLGLKRMTDLCKSRLPGGMMKVAEEAGAISDDAFKAWGVSLMADVCRQCLAGGALGLHFYTMNLVNPTLGMLRELKLITAEQAAACAVDDHDDVDIIEEGSGKNVGSDEMETILETTLETILVAGQI